MAMPRPENGLRSILKIACDKDTDVITIKAIAKRRHRNSQKYVAWYESFNNLDGIDRAVWYTLSREPIAKYPWLET